VFDDAWRLVQSIKSLLGAYLFVALILGVVLVIALRSTQPPWIVGMVSVPAVAGLMGIVYALVTKNPQDLHQDKFLEDNLMDVLKRMGEDEEAVQGGALEALVASKVAAQVRLLGHAASAELNRGEETSDA